MALDVGTVHDGGGALVFLMLFSYVAIPSAYIHMYIGIPVYVCLSPRALNRHLLFKS